MHGKYLKRGVQRENTGITCMYIGLAYLKNLGENWGGRK